MRRHFRPIISDCSHGVYFSATKDVRIVFIQFRIQCFINIKMSVTDCELAILAAYLLETSSSDDDDNNREDATVERRRRVWRNDWLAERETDSFSAKLLVDLRASETELYSNFVRMSAHQFDHLLGLVTPFIKKQDTNMRMSISASERLVLTLSFLATGESFRSLQYRFRIPQTTISRIIPDVLDAIYNVLVGDFVKTPTTECEWEDIARKFNDGWQFPNCIGAVGGKHVVMVTPPNAGSVFHNYKGTHSIILVGVADAEYKLLYIDVGRNGKFSDSNVFNRCTFGQAMDTNHLRLPPPKPLPGREISVPYTLVADDALAMRENALKPYAQQGLTMVRRIFNYRLSRAHGIIENVFGILSARFRVLRKRTHLDAIKTRKVVLACCVLHNYLMATNKAVYAPSTSFDQYDDQGNVLVPADWRADENSAMVPLEAVQDQLPNAEEVQDEFAAYFVEEGDLEWQYAHI